MNIALRAVLAVIVLALVVAAGLLAGSYAGRTAEQTAKAETIVLDGPVENDEVEEPKGAPIDAPTEVDPEPMAGMDESIAADGVTLPSSISAESLALLEEANAGLSEDLTFERTKDGEYWKATFSQLASFEYALPDRDAVLATLEAGEELENQIPEEIMNLDGENVLVLYFCSTF